MTTKSKRLSGRQIVVWLSYAVLLIDSIALN
mgnify:CR=1 FL=1